MAVKLESTQFKIWKEKGKTSDDVFKMLRLDIDQSIDTLKSPGLVSWFSMHQEEADNVMSSVMTKYYDDETVKKMVTHSSITGNLKATAAQVASALWLREGMSAHEAFKVLRLSGKGDNALSDPAFGTWVSYFNKLQRKKMNQDEYAIIAELSKHFDNDLNLARALKAAKTKLQDLPTEEEESSSEEDDEAVDVDSDDDNEGVSGTSSEEDAASTNLGAGVISNDSDADEGDTEADQPRAAQTIVV
ncbi:hypothetical protein PInf_004433 [Phytophthora infestans]|nr:hypothetical protein PInf_004433 [Phytophthora infestans]